MFYYYFYVYHNLLTRFLRARSWGVLFLRRSQQWLWFGHGDKSCAETLASACIQYKFWSDCSHRGLHIGWWTTGCKPPTGTTKTFCWFIYWLISVTLRLRDIWLVSGEKTNGLYVLIVIMPVNKHKHNVTAHSCIMKTI